MSGKEGMIDSIKEYLGMVASMYGDRPNPTRFLLDNAVECGPRIASDLPMMEKKLCYNNSFLTIASYDVDPAEWFYCEGYAVQSSLGLPIQHAWLVNRNGDVIDLTWDWDEGETFAYYGIPFRIDYLRENALRTGYPSPMWANEMFNVSLLGEDPDKFKEFDVNPGAQA